MIVSFERHARYGDRKDLLTDLLEIDELRFLTTTALTSTIELGAETTSTS
jgi:hypothetical protein